jgi:hypothetical protein
VTQHCHFPQTHQSWHEAVQQRANSLETIVFCWIPIILAVDSRLGLHAHPCTHNKPKRVRSGKTMAEPRAIARADCHLTEQLEKPTIRN